MRKRPTTESAIALLKEKYPNKFDYSKFLYTRAADKVILICKDCGLEFLTTYNILRKGTYGCPKCYRQSTRRTKEDLLDIIELYYPNKYDSSKITYINTRTPITLVCKLCNTEFNIEPLHIVRNYIKELCPVCRKNQEIQNNYKLFLDRLATSSLHVIPNGNDFSTYKLLMGFTCTKCGNQFKSTPDNILSSSIGCPICAEDSRRKTRTHTTELFIKDAKKLHGNAYNYDKTIYTGRHQQLIITCPKHGDFTMFAGDHLLGSGCPKCSLTKGERLVLTYLDKYKINYQILVTIKDAKFHLQHIRVDFYIESLNTIIEYNGKLHYEPVDYFGGEERFKKQVERDNDLRQYCKDNNIKLVEISYQKSKDEIEEIIKTL